MLDDTSAIQANLSDTDLYPISIIAPQSRRGRVLTDGYQSRSGPLERETSKAIPKAIIANFYALARSKLSDALYTRLVRLAIRREEASSAEMNVRSLGGFLKFWEEIRSDAVEPEIFVLPNGNLQAEWATGKNLLVIEFRPNSAIFFSLNEGASCIEGRESPARIVHFCDYLLSRNPNPLLWG